jgi:type I restriction enzyme S subunit
MNNWVKEKIGEILTLQRGFDITKKTQTYGLYPVVSSSGITSYHNEFKVRGPGVVIGRKGTLGTAFYIQSDFWPHDTTLWVKDFKGNYPQYIYYFLKALPLAQFDSGSSNPTLNRNFVHQMDAFKPTLENQIKIANLLSTLDSKIELNNRINAELEAMAKTLYDYWFVQFDFPFDFAQGKPDANSKPYKSSGGKMVYNSILKRKIPDGWDVTKIGKIAKTVLGGTPDTGVDEYWENADIPWLSSAEIASFPVINSEQKTTQKGIENSAATILPKGTVVISIVRYIRPSILGIDAATNQSVVGIKECSRLKSSFIYPYFCSEVPRLMGLRTGAQQPHINKGVIEDSSIALPPDDILESYYEITIPIYEQIMNLAFQNYELIKLRDWLLPMLMNGQVTVK